MMRLAGTCPLNGTRASGIFCNNAGMYIDFGNGYTVQNDNIVHPQEAGSITKRTASFRTDRKERRQSEAVDQRLLWATKCNRRSERPTWRVSSVLLWNLRT
jgi:hypothetical protein